MTFESIAEYGCNEGFTLSGNQSRTCQADGTWSGVDPVCVPLTISGGKSQLEKLGPIIGGVLGGFTVAALITACFLATIVRRQRIRNKGTMTIMDLQSNQRSGDQAALTHFQHTELADAIETSRNEAYGTSIATPCHEAYNTSTVAIITSQNEAYGTSIATPCHEAYNTSTVAIITSQNEAYGTSIATPCHEAYNTSTVAIITSQNEAYGTSIATPCNEAYNTSTVAIITSQNEAYGTSIATPCNEAYNTSTVAIITCRNEAYGSLQPGGRDSRSDDYGYVINQLDYEEVGARLSAQYDYVQVDSPDQSGKYTHE